MELPFQPGLIIIEEERFASLFVCHCIEKNQGFLQQAGGKWIVLFPVEIVGIAGCNKRPGLITGTQLPEFIERYVVIIGRMRGK